MTPAVRARLVGLLEDLARTDVGQLVAASGRWLRRQVAAEGSQCSQGGCTAPATRVPPDGGPGGLCVAHLVELDDYHYGCCMLDEGHDGPCVWLCADCNGTGGCLDCDQHCRCDDVVSCGWCDGTHACPSGCYEGRFIEGA